MKKIIVALDFEEKADVLIGYALKLAEKFGSKIWLVHVALSQPDFVGFDASPMYIAEYRDKELKTEKVMLNSYLQKLKDAGADAEALLIEGMTVNLILEAADNIKADIMIVGSHGHGFFYRLWMGDTAEQIIRSHTVPTLVVPL